MELLVVPPCSSKALRAAVIALSSRKLGLYTQQALQSRDFTGVHAAHSHTLLILDTQPFTLQIVALYGRSLRDIVCCDAIVRLPE
jgi:hypothetical protein